MKRYFFEGCIDGALRYRITGGKDDRGFIKAEMMAMEPREMHDL